MTAIDERYGRTPGAHRRNRLIAYIAAAGFVLVIGAWVLWGGVLDSISPVNAQDTGHTVVSDHEVTVSWDLTIPAGSASACAIQALNGTYGIVGWKIVDIPASNTPTRSFSESVVTSEQSVNGLIYRCWLT